MMAEPPNNTSAVFSGLQPMDIGKLAQDTQHTDTEHRKNGKQVSGQHGATSPDRARRRTRLAPERLQPLHHACFASGASARRCR